MLTPASARRVVDAVLHLKPDWQRSQVRVEAWLDGGYRNANYRLRYAGRAYVLRVPGAGDAIDRGAEAAALDYVAGALPAASRHSPAAGTPGAQPGCFRAAVTAFDVPRGLLLTPFYDWPLLAEQPRVSGTRLGRYLLRLHEHLACAEVDRPAHFSASQGLRERIVEDLAAAAVSAAARRTVEDLPPLPSDGLAHQDLNAWNILLGAGDRWLTLDWETLSSGSLALDLASLLVGYSRAHGLSQAATRALTDDALAVYRTPTGARIDADAYRLARQWFEWREYAWAAAQARSSNTRKEIVRQREDFAARLAAQGFEPR